MYHDLGRRLSTGGLPPIKIREQYLVEEASSYDSTPCYTAWVREEILQVPHGWSASDFNIANERPQWSLQIYDTTPQATGPDRLKTLAETLYKETREECRVGGRDRPYRIDVWGMPFAPDVPAEERIAQCKAHILAEIVAREISEENYFHVSELRGHHQWNRVILIIDQLEESWNEEEGAFLAVFWDLHPSYLKMLVRAQGENLQEPETRSFRYTRDELGQLLGRLISSF